MADKTDVVARAAAQGERMIEVKLRFWTNNLADKGQGYSETRLGKRRGSNGRKQKPWH
jgi:hypothetical protein